VIWHGAGIGAVVVSVERCNVHVILLVRVPDPAVSVAEVVIQDQFRDLLVAHVRVLRAKLLLPLRLRRWVLLQLADNGTQDVGHALERIF
jgi:hypothetical protein